MADTGSLSSAAMIYQDKIALDRGGLLVVESSGFELQDADPFSLLRHFRFPCYNKQKNRTDDCPKDS